MSSITSPFRMGLIDYLLENTDTRYVILRKEPSTRIVMDDARLLMCDVVSALTGGSTGMFSGILIKKERSKHTMQGTSVIAEGLQRLRTISLLSQAVLEIMISTGMDAEAVQTGPLCRPVIPYVLIPKKEPVPYMMKDEEVYQCIARRDYQNGVCAGSEVYATFEFFLDYLKSLLNSHTTGQIRDAVNKLYVVVIP